MPKHPLDSAEARRNNSQNPLIRSCNMLQGMRNRARYSMLDEALTNLRRVLESGDRLPESHMEVLKQINDLTRHRLGRLLLSPEQLHTALSLRSARPPVVPGTNAILPSDAATKWYDAVYAKMQQVGIVNNMEKTAIFCDIAGVAN